ncbi:MAG: CofH family radical SAM protein [Cyanobacteriota bacterium]
MTQGSAPPEAWNALDPEAWQIAGRLLVDPSQVHCGPAEARPAESFPAEPGASGSLSLSELLSELLRCNRRARENPESPFPLTSLLSLGRALMSRPLEDVGREQVRRAADAWRQELVGDTVTYVVNRNLNASNVCVLRCGFCAFRRSAGEEGAFRLSRAQLRERAAEARARGATELCLQAGLDPEASDGQGHLAAAVSLLRDLRQAAPGLHLHGFSPQELLFIAQRDRLPLREVLHTLRQAGLNSVPGTAAEVLAPRVRRLICPEKLSARAWVAVIWQVHQAGLPSTSTLMAGHLETPLEQLCHFCTLGALQWEAWRHGRTGFSEFILLPFVGASAPASLRARVGRDQPDPQAMLLLTAQARLLLGPWIRHHQSSWVKLTLPVAAQALRWGCDDLGGTLMEEHITTMAGAAGGTQQTPEALQAAAREQQRPVRQRTTLYGALTAPCGSS